MEACPHCHDQVHKTEDGCGTERCMARRAFIRQAAIMMRSHLGAMNDTTENDVWSRAERLWNNKPEGC
jgi:hypothetical protein